MTARRRLSRFAEAAVAAAAIAVAVVAWPAPAWGQACCAGGSLVTPTRLAPYEDVGLGLQLRARGNLGLFDASGRYVAASSAEQGFEQQLAASFRLARRTQAGVLVPFIQTRRAVSGLDEWGGGLGDTSVTLRHELVFASDTVYWPGVALLAGVGLPTGTPVDRASRPLATDATGTGAFDLTAGLALEQTFGAWYLAASSWLTTRRDRDVAVAGGGHVTQSYGLRSTTLAAAGYVFASEAAVAGYVSFFDEGDARVDGAAQPASRRRLTTVGAAAVLPVAETWRVQGAVFADLPWAPFGRNQLAGVGAAAAVVRIWH